MNEAALRLCIEERTGRSAPASLRILTDTSNFLVIDQGDVVVLEGRHFLIGRNMREGRFGIDDQPKYWVKKALDLETGRAVILKLVFHEEFRIRIGLLRIRCYRSAEKESRILELTRGDDRFMQGGTLRDARGNRVRVADFIPGPSLYRELSGLRLEHEPYCREILPGVLRRLHRAVGAIASLHALGAHHGDIRNDHLLIDPVSGELRWIDFDLSQDIPDFDIWSLGNILLYVVGKGEHTFADVATGRLGVPDGGALTRRDASAFFVHRVMNLGKLFPWIPEELNEILLHFSFGTRHFYESAEEVLLDLGRAVDRLDPAGAAGAAG